MILIGLYIYIFCGILWMLKIREIIIKAFDDTNYSFINVSLTILYSVFCWLPLFIYWLHGYIIGFKQGIEDVKNEEEHKEN